MVKKKKKDEATIELLKKGRKVVNDFNDKAEVKYEPPMYPPVRDIVTCDCGVLIDLDTAKKQQWDWNKVRQEVNCPVCRSKLWRNEQ